MRPKVLDSIKPSKTLLPNLIYKTLLPLVLFIIETCVSLFIFIPKSLDFYSAYGSIPYFDASVLDSKISKGFYMELMSLIDMVKSSGMYSASTNAVRTQFIRTLTIINFEASLKKSESDWYDYDINKYDYAAINYAGQMNYGILTGIIYSNNTLSDMRRDISRAEAVTMLNRVLTKSKNRNIINDMRYVNETKDISVFAPYILRWWYFCIFSIN